MITKRGRLAGPRGPGLGEGDTATLQSYVDDAAAQVALATAEKVAAGDAAVAAAGSAGDADAAALIAEGHADAAAISALTATDAAALVYNQLRFSSVRFPEENGESATAGETGAISITNQNRLTRTTVDYDTPIFPSASDACLFFFCTIPESYQGIQRLPRLVGVAGNATTPQNLNIGFRAGRLGSSASDRSDGMRFHATICGVSGTGGPWAVEGASFPAGKDGGRFLVALRKLSDELHLDYWDLDTGTKYASPSPTAKPGSWVGVDRFQGPIVLGGTQASAFPWSDWAAGPWFGKSNFPPFRGELGDLCIADGTVSDETLEDIMAGEDIVDTIGSGNIRLYMPLTTAGFLDLTTIVTNKPAAPTPTLLGKVYPGSTLKRQGPTTYLTVDRVPDPGLIARRNGKRVAEMQFLLTKGDQTGDVMCRFLDERGAIVKGPHKVGRHTDFVDGKYGAWTVMDVIGKRPQHAEFWLTSHPNIVCRVNTNMWVGAAVMPFSQSEFNYAIGGNPSLQWTPGYDSAPLVRFEGDAGRSFFVINLRGLNAKHYIRHSQYDTSFMSDAGATIANYWARKADEPLFLVAQTQNGTSLRALMEDGGSWSTADRSWDDTIAVGSKLANRGKNGEIIVTGTIQPGWNAADPFDDYANLMLVPWFRGEPTSVVPADKIDHFLYDGTFALDAKIVVTPIARGATYSPGKVSDRYYGVPSPSYDPAKRRQSFYEAATIFGAEVGPEWAIHKLEGTTGGGHPQPKDLDGDVQAAGFVAESICMAAGWGSYKGPNRFISLAWVSGSGNTEIIATLGGPVNGPLRTWDGTGDAAGFEAKLSTGSGPEDGWSYLNIASVEVIGARQVKITLASAGTPGQTQITYHSGGLGGYEHSYDPTWRAGQLLAGAWPVCGGNTPIATI